MPNQNRQQRDLSWCLQSAPLVTTGALDFTWPDDNWFNALSNIANATELPTPRHSHRFRLGQHFERLLEYWLKQHRDFDLLAANLQVNARKRTIGEFDFLVTHDGVTQHWEAAVKFYLAKGDPTDTYRWYGPNPADCLGSKYAHLVDHQLRLASDPDALQLLNDMNIEVSSALCFMKGRLFHPYDEFIRNNFQYPHEVNPGHEKGWWLPTDRFTSTFDDTHNYALLEKTYWLAPLEQDIQGESIEEFNRRLASTEVQPASLVAVLDDNGIETSRGFVVTDRWFDLIEEAKTNEAREGSPRHLP